MRRSDRLATERITTVRFRIDATADDVTARLLESARRTDLSLLTVTADDTRVYPPGPGNEIETATAWRAELLWRDDARALASHLQVFLRRAEVFLDCRNGVHVEASVSPRRPPPRRVRDRGAYGLDGSFFSNRSGVLDEPV